jgi:hypothetical protein
MENRFYPEALLTLHRSDKAIGSAKVNADVAESR